LQQTDEGRDFLAALDGFLQEYGHRSELWSVSYPSWREDPTPVFRTLRDYLAQPDLNLDNDLATAAQRREERIAAVRAQLEGYPQPVLEKFEFLLHAAQVGTVLSEDHGFWIDFYCVDCFRQVLREFGRRLAALGALDAADDVFFLSREEVRATALAQPTPDQRPKVAARKAEMERFANVQPPPVLGTPPDGEPEDSAGERADRKFFGGPAPAGSTPDLIRGNSGSAGKVQGRVKVIHNLSEASKLSPGDILVAVTTAPPWTPLFASVAAVVTDTGGVLSHCAVVAREYGIPAVVGTGVATEYLHDGQWVEVDGDAGTVRVLEMS
jgi:pyruvate,water dikinase